MRSLLLPLCVPLIAACAHSTPAPAAAAATPGTPQVKTVYVEKQPQPKACSADADCSSKQLCLQQVCTDITPAIEACSVARVHFDFDKADLHPGDVPALQRMARCLAADADDHVLVEGNCDERGTVEYNLALGDRRAAAVQSYLESLGAPAAQLATVSYGKELPLCTTHDEACWARNRRAVLESNARPRDLSALERRDEAREHHHQASAEPARRARHRVASSQETPAAGGAGQK